MDYGSDQHSIHVPRTARGGGGTGLTVRPLDSGPVRLRNADFQRQDVRVQSAYMKTNGYQPPAPRPISHHYAKHNTNNSNNKRYDPYAEPATDDLSAEPDFSSSNQFTSLPQPRKPKILPPKPPAKPPTTRPDYKRHEIHCKPALVPHHTVPPTQREPVRYVPDASRNFRQSPAYPQTATTTPPRSPHFHHRPVISTHSSNGTWPKPTVEQRKTNHGTAIKITGIPKIPLPSRTQHLGTPPQVAHSGRNSGSSSPMQYSPRSPRHMPPARPQQHVSPPYSANRVGNDTKRWSTASDQQYLRPQGNHGHLRTSNSDGNVSFNSRFRFAPVHDLPPPEPFCNEPQTKLSALV